VIHVEFVGEAFLSGVHDSRPRNVNI
jgi:hypothetical protein